MSLTEVRNVVLLFSNPVWAGQNTVPSTIIRNITALSSSIAYKDTIHANLTTLTKTNAETRNGVIQGLLYLPDIPVTDPCYHQQFDFIPRNVTTQALLPPTNYNLIALAPWLDAACTKAYLAAARLDPIRGFIFYRPNNSSRAPQGIESPIWDLGDGGAWHTENHFPIFAVPGIEGAKMMAQLSLYSGNMSTVPYGPEIQEIYDPHPKDYVRVWTELTIADSTNLPAMWTWILLVVGCLLFTIALVSLVMHLFQRRGRISLRNRVREGEVDLEAMGIKRVTVPTKQVQAFPLFTYQFQPDPVGTPISPRSPRSARSTRCADRNISDVMSPTSRTHRSSVGGSKSTVATNYQPMCHICLERYEDRVTVIRQLSCGHIFHPECIDEFLCRNSSLCPICKKCMLSPGYSPKITNNMVRRERAIRRLRERVVIDDSDGEDGEVKRGSWGRRIFTRNTTGPTNEVPMTMASVAPARTPKTGRTPGSLRVSPPTVITLAPDATPAPAEKPAEAPQLSPVQPIPPTAEEHEPKPVSKDPEQLQLQLPQPVTAAPQTGLKRRPHSLQIEVPPPVEPPLAANQLAGRKSPSALARERMRTLAGTPLDDPDQRRPKWKRAVTRIFPGFS